MIVGGAHEIVPYFMDVEFPEGSSELFIQSFMKHDSFRQGNSTFREQSLEILQRDASTSKLVELVNVSRRTGSAIKAEKEAQVSLCNWYVGIWVEERPGLCLDAKYRTEITRLVKSRSLTEILAINNCIFLVISVIGCWFPLN